MKEKSAENVIQANLSGMLANKGGSVAILSDNGTEFKNKAVNEACDQFRIKRLFSNPLPPQGNSGTEDVHNFLKWTLTNFWESSDLEWNNLLPFACYCCNIFPSSNGTDSTFFIMFWCHPAEDD